MNKEKDCAGQLANAALGLALLAGIVVFAVRHPFKALLLLILFFVLVFASLAREDSQKNKTKNQTTTSVVAADAKNSDSLAK